MAPDTTRPRRRTAVERRDDLMDAAAVVMSERGVAAATTRAIAEQAGVPQGVFHYCFRSRDELVAALFEREITRTVRSVGDALGTSADLRTGVRAALTAQTGLVRDAPEYHLALAELSLVVQRTPALAGLAVWEQDQYRLRVRAHVEEWSSAQSLTWAVPLDDLAAYLVALGAGIASTWLADRDDARADAAIAVAVESLGGLARS